MLDFLFGRKPKLPYLKVMPVAYCSARRVKDVAEQVLPAFRGAFNGYAVLPEIRASELYRHPHFLCHLTTLGADWNSKFLDEEGDVECTWSADDDREFQRICTQRPVDVAGDFELKVVPGVAATLRKRGDNEGRGNGRYVAEPMGLGKAFARLDGGDIDYMNSLLALTSIPVVDGIFAFGMWRCGYVSTHLMPRFDDSGDSVRGSLFETVDSDRYTAQVAKAALLALGNSGIFRGMKLHKDVETGSRGGICPMSLGDANLVKSGQMTWGEWLDARGTAYCDRCNRLIETDKK